MKRIVLTGGGSGGHVNANLALIPELLSNGWEIYYIGSKSGIESKIVPRDSVEYYSIRTGKLRRYFDIKNFIDPFNVLIGIFQAFRILRRLKPSVIFSKGGFVSLPVVVAGWLNRIPIIIHEGDTTIGLANKLSFPFSRKICTSFEETIKRLPEKKACFTRMPIRNEVIKGDRKEGYRICGFKDDVPVVMVVGGSLGATSINNNIRTILPKLLESFQVLHICGKGSIDSELNGLKGYKQFEYIQEELPHIFAMADIIVSRAGTNSVFEILALKKAALLIPLPTKTSRGEQLLNAETFRNRGFSKVLLEEEFTEERLLDEILDLFNQRDKFVQNMNNVTYPDGIVEIMKLINEYGD